MPVLGLDPRSTLHQHRIVVAAPVSFLDVREDLAFHLHHRGRRILLTLVLWPVIDGPELPGLLPSVELLAYLAE